MAPPTGYLNRPHHDRRTRGPHHRPRSGTRAPHIRGAFDTYAGGGWSLNGLAAEPEIRGLTRRPTATRDARPIPANKRYDVLTNRYYLGYVSWRGVEYPGKHEPLIDAETFERVQQVLQAHKQSSGRPQKHTPYLAGSIFCGRCRCKLDEWSVTRRQAGLPDDEWDGDDLREGVFNSVVDVKTRAAKKKRPAREQEEQAEKAAVGNPLKADDDIRRA